MKEKFLKFLDKHIKPIVYLYCVNIVIEFILLFLYLGLIDFAGVQYNWIFYIFAVLSIPYFILSILYFILFIRLGTGDLKD